MANTRCLFRALCGGWAGPLRYPGQRLCCLFGCDLPQASARDYRAGHFLMRLVSADEVHRICEWGKLVDAMAEAHRGGKPLVERCELHDGRNTYLNLPAWLPGVAMGSKIVTVFPDN